MPFTCPAQLHYTCSFKAIERIGRRCKSKVSSMEYSEEVDKLQGGPTTTTTIFNPLIFCTKLISLEAELVSKCVVSLASPFLSVISLVFRVRGGGALLGRIAMGLLAAAYVCMVLVVVLAVSAAVGIGLVRGWVEEPLHVRECLQFDYTEAHPTALFSIGVPVGHTLYVSLLLLMPDSDYNRDLGIFQLTAEVISVEGNVIAKSSHPSMLRFRSWPIRYMRTFVMGVPLLLEITSETQRITFPILKHKEDSYPRTEDVRITLIPRAGTSSLPQFYDAQVVVKSRPPWTKELVYNWQLTFCVWTTIYLFLIILMFLVLFLKPLIFPVMAKRPEQDAPPVERWQRSTSKRKAAALLQGAQDSGGSESVCCN